MKQNGENLTAMRFQYSGKVLRVPELLAKENARHTSGLAPFNFSFRSCGRFVPCSIALSHIIRCSKTLISFCRRLRALSIFGFATFRFQPQQVSRRLLQMAFCCTTSGTPSISYRFLSSPETSLEVSSDILRYRAPPFGTMHPIRFCTSPSRPRPDSHVY